METYVLIYSWRKTPKTWPKEFRKRGRFAGHLHKLQINRSFRFRTELLKNLPCYTWTLDILLDALMVYIIWVRDRKQLNMRLISLAMPTAGALLFFSLSLCVSISTNFRPFQFLILITLLHLVIIWLGDLIACNRVLFFFLRPSDSDLIEMNMLFSRFCFSEFEVD